jgi:hypothetical protein
VQLIKKTVSPTGVTYQIGPPVPLWLAGLIGVSLIVGAVLMLTLFVVWLLSSRRRSDDAS